jgi:hypothetical protein
VVLLTDGRDEGSALSVEDGLKVAQEVRIPVFGVGVGRVQERVLRRIAKLTAGDYTTVAETTGGTLAARILEAAASAAPASAAPTPLPQAPSPAPAGDAAAPPVRPRPFPLGWLAALLLGTAAIVATALVVLARRRPAPPRGAPRTAATSAAGPSRAAVPSQAGARPPAKGAHSGTGAPVDEPATVFSRMELGSETVERTVLLREQAVLEITAGPGKGRVFPLSGQSATSVGRARANDVVLEDESISAQHMRIRPEDGRFVLHDLGSTNGTRVNDRRVSRHPLEDGDLVRVGDTCLRFRLSQGR